MSTRPESRAAIEPHLLIHRDETSYVHFQYDPVGESSIEVGAKVIRHDVPGTEGGWVRVRELQQLDTWIPELREHFLETLGRDAYISINSGWRPKGWLTSTNLRRINTTWVDCDCEDLDYFEAVALLSSAQGSGLIPPLSVIQRSGRGVWAFWLLRGAEDDPNLPPEAFARNRELATRINGVLAERLARYFPTLAPDAGARHMTSHHRVAGSINSRTGLPVEFTVNLDQSNHPPRYTLEELQTFLDLPDRLQPPSLRPAGSTTTRQPKKRAGFQARHEHPLAELQLLRARRRGFEKGHRRKACQFLASLALGAGWDRKEVERDVVALATECDPRLPRAEALQQVRSAAQRPRHPANRTIAKELDVSAEEVESLGLRKIRPDFESPQKRTGQQTAQREARQSFLVDLAGKHGSPLPFTFDQLQKLLGDAGHSDGRGTVQRDLQQLKLRTANAKSSPGATAQASLL